WQVEVGGGFPAQVGVGDGLRGGGHGENSSVLWLYGLLGKRWQLSFLKMLQEEGRQYQHGLVHIVLAVVQRHAVGARHDVEMPTGVEACGLLLHAAGRSGSGCWLSAWCGLLGGGVFVQDGLHGMDGIGLDKPIYIDISS
ncbi:MAG TPA: hypothetical protein PLR92_16435, partial [Alicycliphilus denitrificans]|nr:hypothetical protein [Alicycliphilus denitrificans]